MLKNFTIIILLVLCSCTSKKEKVYGDLIKDLAFKNEQYLTEKYGVPKKEIHKPKDNTNEIEDVSDLIGYYALRWTLEDNVNITASYNNENFLNPKSVLIDNFFLDKEHLHEQFGWDKPTFKNVGEEILIEDLQGIKASYNDERKTLHINFENPNIENIGKRI